MAKTREKKGQMIDGLNEKFQNAKMAVLVDYRGLKVTEIEELRGILRSKKVSFNVAKNSLIKIALKKQGIEFEASMFEKPIAIAFAMEDEVTPAREINLYAKKHEAVEILGGIMDKQVIDASVVRKLALLPSREELLARAVGSISSPLRGMVNVMAGNLRGLINIINGYKEKIS